MRKKGICKKKDTSPVQPIRVTTREAGGGTQSQAGGGKGTGYPIYGDGKPRDKAKE